VTDQIRRWAASLLATVATSCATVSEPVPGDATVLDIPAAEVWARVERSLRVRGLTLLGNPAGPGPLAALSTGPVARGWATCPTLTMTDPSRRTNRRARVDARDVATRATVSVTEVGPRSTRVAVRTEQIGDYINPFTNNPVARPCTSTGRLERELLDALRLG
jgi:hypothetical protein